MRIVSLDTIESFTKTIQCINRLLQHVILLEFKAISQSNYNIEIIDSDNSETVIRSDEPRLRLVATVNADILGSLRKL